MRPPTTEEGRGVAPRIVVGRAQVAELVDALVSGISGRKAVGVRVPSWACCRDAEMQVDMHLGLEYVRRTMHRFFRLARIALMLGLTGIMVSAVSAAPRGLTFHFEDNRMFVPVFLDGKGPYAFLLDTGATDWAVDSRVANALKLRLQQRSHSAGVGSRSIDIRHAAVAAISFDARDFRQVPVLVIDLGAIRHALGLKHFDGIVGSTALRGLTLVVDNDNDTVDVEPAPKNVPAAAHSVTFTDSDGLIRLPATIEGIPSTVVVDTGDRWYLSLFKPFARLHGFENRGGSRSVATGYGLGGPTYSKVFRIRDMRLFGFMLPALLTRASTDRAGIFASAPEAGTVGGGVLRRFNEVYDYARHRITVWPSRHFRDRSTEVPCAPN